MSEPKYKNAGGLWKKKTTSGTSFLAGEVEVDGKKMKISIWKNDNKTEDKHPDYRISTPNEAPVVSEQKPKPKTKVKEPEQKQEEEEDDDIPF